MYNKLHYQHNENKRKQMYEQSKNQHKHVSDSVKKFKQLIFDGPFYICVCCHRCLYKRSVLNYSQKIPKFSIVL